VNRYEKDGYNILIPNNFKILILKINHKHGSKFELLPLFTVA